MKLNIGIDASIHATGICFTTISETNEQKSKYYLIVPYIKPKVTTRKSNRIPKKLYSDSCTVIRFSKIPSGKEFIYSHQDLAKALSANHQSEIIKNLLIKVIEEIKSENEIEEVSIRMEGALISTGFSSSKARVNDLIAYAVEIRRAILMDEKLMKLISYFSIVAVGTLKKHGTGKGNAKKEQMIECHQNLFADSFDYEGKVDDLVDAYWLSTIDPGKNKLYFDELHALSNERLELTEQKNKDL